MRTRQHIVNRFALFALAAHIVFMNGCVEAYHPVKVDGQPNTFMLSENCTEGEIVFVEVVKGKEVVWRIEASKEINAKGFTVTVGRVPEAFHQVIPQHDKDFNPVKGDKYSIDIFCHCKPPKHPLETYWVAD